MSFVGLVAGIIFVATLVAILLDRVDRTIVVMAGATVMVIAGNQFGFYSEKQALYAIDFETLGLLLGMMILTLLLQRTGFFQYVAIVVAKASRRSPWLLLVVLGTVTTLLSTILPNVTVIILMVPVTILIAQITGISPVPLLIAETMLSNTGGVATLVGDPPNVMIASAAAFSFNDFLTHTAPIAFLAWLATLLVLRIMFRSELAGETKNVEGLINLDEGAALEDSLGAKRLLIVLGAVVVLFFAQGRFGVSPSFVALVGAAIALVWLRPDMEEILPRIEWPILFFFAGLFVIVGGLEAAGLLELLATTVSGLAKTNLLLAGVLLLIIAALVSALVDNIPFTIAMIPIIQQLGNFGVSVSPLWWALALGAGFGGNGTIIGSASNLITVSLSEKTHTPITGKAWMRVGLPVMATTCGIGILIFVVFFDWMGV